MSTQETAYAIKLDAEKGNHFHYRAISRWAGKFGLRGRDIREPEPAVVVASFEHIMKLLGQPFTWVRNDKDLDGWIGQFGWMLTPPPFAEKRLACMLHARTCVKSAIGLFWDVDIPRNRAISRRISQPLRQRVLARDGHKCIQCGETDANKLTMDHIIPFSRGGETTEGNLVSLCHSCNQCHANKYHPRLFVLADLHHGWDPVMTIGKMTADGITYASMVSQNIMVSRCEKHHLSHAMGQ